ncbi:hypothetical protein D3C77_540760 [compost metagenome]
MRQCAGEKLGGRTREMGRNDKNDKNDKNGKNSGNERNDKNGMNREREIWTEPARRDTHATRAFKL